MVTDEDRDQAADAPAQPEGSAGPRIQDELRDHLREAVAARFERLSGCPVSLWIVDQNALFTVDNDILAGSPDLPPHPLCEGCSDMKACVQKWMASLAGLMYRPEPLSQGCPLGHRCSIIPVVWGGRALAACKLVCPGEVTEETFAHHLDLLDVLVESFQTLHADLLARIAGAGAACAQGSGPPLAGPAGLPPGEGHPQVHNALAYIESRLSDPKLTVAGIAADLKINSTYLSHLFAEQVGTRMGRYIAQRRIEMAKYLLATTNWQVKRVAYESGHKNADWFSQVFHAHVGATPCEYRESSRSQDLRLPRSRGRRDKST